MLGKGGDGREGEEDGEEGEEGEEGDGGEEGEGGEGGEGGVATEAAKAKAKAAVQFRVSSLHYAKAHTVAGAVLRPQWQWAPKAQVWRYELEMGHGCCGGEADALPTFKFATGVGRSRCGGATPSA